MVAVKKPIKKTDQEPELNPISFVVHFGDKEDFEWLKNYVDAVLAKAESNLSAYVEYIPMFKRLVQAFEQCEKAVSVHNPAAELEVQVAKVIKKTVRKEQKEADVYCEAHPLYAAVRAPRKDCEQCWNQYEKMQHYGAASPQRKEFYNKFNNAVAGN